MHNDDVVGFCFVNFRGRERVYFFFFCNFKFFDFLNFFLEILLGNKIRWIIFDVVHRRMRATQGGVDKTT